MCIMKEVLNQGDFPFRLGAQSANNDDVSLRFHFIPAKAHKSNMTSHAQQLHNTELGGQLVVIRAKQKDKVSNQTVFRCPRSKLSGSLASTTGVVRNSPLKIGSRAEPNSQRALFYAFYMHALATLVATLPVHFNKMNPTIRFTSMRTKTS